MNSGNAVVERIFNGTLRPLLYCVIMTQVLVFCCVFFMPQLTPEILTLCIILQMG
jgi:hypothetical protein